MSAGPTSGADAERAAALERAGWSNAELVWEQIEECAAERLGEGERSEAAELWRGALEVAEEWFVDHDPRLAASLVNCAVAAGWSDQQGRRTELLDRALRIWDSSGSWVAALEPEHRARSSTFHLRLLAKHRGGYDHHARERYEALAGRGREIVLAHHAGGSADAEGLLVRWRRVRPSRLTDERKLLAAVHLMLPATLP